MHDAVAGRRCACTGRRIYAGFRGTGTSVRPPNGHLLSVFRKIATYGLSIYAATLLSSAISFAVTMVVARHISKEALGAYGFYVTIYSLFGMIFGSGLNQSLVKFLGRTM